MRRWEKVERLGKAERRERMARTYVTSPLNVYVTRREKFPENLSCPEGRFLACSLLVHLRAALVIEMGAFGEKAVVGFFTVQWPSVSCGRLTTCFSELTWHFGQRVRQQSQYLRNLAQQTQPDQTE